MNEDGYRPDAPATISSAIHLNVISAAVLLVQPAFVQALVERLGFGERVAGEIAAAEMLGVAIGAALFALLARRVPWRPTAAAAIAVMALGTLATAAADGGGVFLATRLVVGTGAGWIMSMSFEAVGRSRQPDRNFAWLVAVALIFGAIVVFAMPGLLDRAGMRGFLIGLAVYYATGLVVTARMPHGARPAQSSKDRDATVPLPARRLAVAAMFLYYIAQGAVWSYLALMGTAHGLDADAVATAITLSQLAGLSAVLAASALALRVHRAVALAAGILAAGIALAGLVGPQTALTYTALVCVFNAAWNWTDPFLLGTMARVDASGRVMVWAIAWRLLGLAAGPFLAAMLVAEGELMRVSTLGIAMLCGSLLCLVVPLRALRRAA